jgi:general secretion pathway protein M
VKEWYESLSGRDQLILVPLVLVLLLFLLYGMVWSPIATATERSEVANRGALDTLDWMREAVVQINGRRGGQSQAAEMRSISAVVDSSLPQHKLVMKRYQPIGEQGAQVWLEDASLPEVIAWLSALEAGSGMRLDNVSIVSSDKQGYVKTRVRLERN